MYWLSILKEEGKYKVYITGESNTKLRGWHVFTQDTDEIHYFSSRQEAYDWLKEDFIKKGNPRPWTIEGSLYEGHAVVYDGIFLMINAPSYFYAIVKEGDSPPDPHEINVNWTSRDRLRERMRGNEYDPRRDEFDEDFKEDNE